MNIEKTINSSWTAISKITNTERGFNILIMILSLFALVASVWYFVGNIREIVHEHGEAIKEQRQEFLQALKDIK